MIKSFEPIVDKDCRILILGSMPSVKSLEKHQYYGNKQNHFWKIIYELFNEEFDDDYERRKTFLLKHHVAVWDVLKSCDRKGSSDSKIVNPVPNDFDAFFRQYPNIKSVFFNGSKAEELFKKMVEAELNIRKDILFHRLPSTSPANAVKYKDKLEQWKIILSEHFWE